MKIISFDGTAFAALGLSAGLPNEFPGPDVQPQESAQSSGPIVPIAPIIGVRSQPVLFSVLPGFQIEPTLGALMSLLNPLNPVARNLVAVRKDGTRVAMLAYVGPWAKAATNQVLVTFFLREPVWREVLLTTWAKTFTASPDQVLAVPIGGESPSPPRIRIQPVLQRSLFSATLGWRWRRRAVITSAAPDSAFAHPYAINLGLTNGLVTNSKALASGDDVRVFWQDKELPRELKNWNSATLTTDVWVIIPDLKPGKTLTLDVVYGNPAAGAPPRFVYVRDDPYKTTILNIPGSTNVLWDWAVAETAANADKGLYQVVAGDEDHNVPGSWDRTNIYDNQDEYAQDDQTIYTVASVNYRHGALHVVRYRQNAGIINVQQNRLYDALMFYSPVGIVSVTYDLKVLNPTDLTAANQVIGRVELYARRAGRDWRQIFMDRVQRVTANSNTIIGPRTDNVQDGGVNATHIMFVGGPYDGRRIPRGADATRTLDLQTNTVMQVALAPLITHTVAAEEEIVDTSAVLRFGGGVTAPLTPPYDEIRIAQGFHLLIPYRGGGSAADELRIETRDGRLNAALWSADGATKREDVSWAVSAIRVERLDGADLTRLGTRPVLTPERERITNTTFATGIAGWAGEGNTAGMTAATSWDSGTQTLQIAVTANTGGVGEWARANFLTDLAVSPGDPVAVAVDAISTALTIWGEIELAWKTAAGADISSAFSPAYTPLAINTPYRRMVVAVAPPNAALVRVRLRARPVAATNIGTVRFDNPSTTGNEVIWIETNPAGTKMSIDVAEGVF